MKFIYSPEGAEAQEFDFEPDRLMSAEAEAIERVTGMTFGEWRRAVLQESIRAQRAFLWVCLKRTRPTLKYTDVEFRTGEIAIDLGKDEALTALKALEEQLATSGELTPEQQEAVDELRDVLAEYGAEDAPDAEPVADDEPEGKESSTPATSLAVVGSTSGPSPTA